MVGGSKAWCLFLLTFNSVVIEYPIDMIIDGYKQRAEVRKQLAADKSWGEKAAPMLEQFVKQENLTMRLFPWSSVVSDVKPGGMKSVVIES